MMNKGLVLEKASTVDIAGSQDLLAIIESMGPPGCIQSSSERHWSTSIYCYPASFISFSGEKLKILDCDVIAVLNICNVHHQYPFH